MKNRTLDELSTYHKSITARRKPTLGRRRWARLVTLRNAVSVRLIGAARVKVQG